MLVSYKEHNSMTKIYCTEPLEKPKWILLKSGLWPVLNVTIISYVKILYNCIFDLSIFAIVISNIIRAIRTRDMKLLNKSTCILVPMTNYTAKTLTLFWNKKCFYSILADTESEVFNNHSGKLNKHIQFIYRISKILSRYFTFAMGAYIAVGSFLPIITNIGLIIPSPFEGGKLDVFYRVYHFFATMYLAFNTLGFDILYLTCMSLCAAQLDILKGRLENVSQETHSYEMNTNVKCRARHILKECAILHEMINQFVKKLSILLSFPLFVQYSCGCFTICNTILQLTILRESGSTNILVMCGFSFVTVGQMATFHWLGNEIIFRSDKIIESSYISNWYELDPHARRILHLIMERAKKPMVIQVYNLIFISLDSLLVIFRWAYSVFALIKARYS